MAALLQLLNALAYQVHVVIFSTRKHPFSIDHVPQGLQKSFDWHPVELDTTIRPLAALQHLFTGQSYILQRFVDEEVQKTLEKVTDGHSFDLVHLESLFTLPYAPLLKKATGAPIVYRAHNVEHHIWQRLQQETRHPFKKWYLQQEANKLQRAEAYWIQHCDGILAISPTDTTWFETHFPSIPALDLPVPVALPEEKTTATNRQPQVFHLGAMDWPPNQAAVQWLLDAVWPRVVAAVPDAQLHLAGRHMPKRHLQLDATGIHVKSEIPDAKAYMAQHDILIVPLQSGSGLRIKILEAMAMGKAVVTTPQGLSGIPAKPGTTVLVGEDAEALARHLIHLLLHPDELYALGARARQWVVDRYHPDKISAQLAAFYQKQLMA